MRASREPRRAGLQRLRDALERWKPPGGWILAALVLVALSTAAGVVFPLSPAGIALQTVVGTLGAPLVPIWSAGAAWFLVRGRRPSLLRLAALVVLSATWLVALALREAHASGVVGDWMLDVLDASFGRRAGLALVSIVAAAALVNVIGLERILACLQAAYRAMLAAWRARRRALPVARALRVPRSPASNEPVILGPPGLAASAVSTGTRRAPDNQPVDIRSRRAERPAQAGPRESTTWRRPDPAILGRATDGGSFSPAELKARARIIEETLESFNIQARVVEVQQGPAITQFGVDPAPGVAVNRIVQRQNDLALRLGAPTLRVLAPVPGRPMVGIEVPNTSVATVKLGDLIASPQFTRARLPIGVGMDVGGKPVVADLTRMPHLLVAGATGSGKSVCINSLITSLLVMRTPDEVQFIMIDPKQVELSQYRGLPHLRLPVVTDMERVVAALRWTVNEMERRYALFADVGARNIVAFNDRFPEERLVYMVVVVDELADMMMTAAEDVERLICRLAQLGRAAGVHIVVATQRPSVDVLTGLIKANLPTRIAFAVSSQIDSRVILDRTGAERLLGRGDALYQAGDEMNPRRVQGALVSDEEIESVCAWWREQGEAQHTADDEAELEKLARQEDPEERLLAQAREILASHDGEITPGYLARRLKIGIQKATRIHQTLVADEAAAYLVAPEGSARE
ncbi:MAG: DNA translocase FtsK [Chloroflexi bacterium]|nr:DNA translocase FtsK [Chloroflexota bacterium]